MRSSIRWLAMIVSLSLLIAAAGWPGATSPSAASAPADQAGTVIRRAAGPILGGGSPAGVAQMAGKPRGATGLNRAAPPPQASPGPAASPAPTDSRPVSPTVTASPATSPVVQPTATRRPATATATAEPTEVPATPTATPRAATPTPRTAPRATATPVPQIPARPFGEIRFGTDWDRQAQELIGEGTRLPLGTKKIVAVVDTVTLPSGVMWSYDWLEDGDITASEDPAPWSGKTSLLLSLSNGGDDIPPAVYELVIYVNDREVQRGAVEVVSRAPVRPTATTVPVRPTATPRVNPTRTPIPSEKVAVAGMIIDSVTGRAIAGASFSLVKPGVTFDDFVAASQSQRQAWILASGTTDRNGLFLTDPPVPTGQIYPVLVSARGYQTTFWDDALEIPRGEPSPFVLSDPVELDR